MISLKKEDDKTSLPLRRPPRPQVDLPPYQERDPYPITGYNNIPTTVPVEGMVRQVLNQIARGQNKVSIMTCLNTYLCMMEKTKMNSSTGLMH